MPTWDRVRRILSVVDSNNKPIYNAKVHVNIAYGLMSKRKYDLEIGTNSDGKARIEGLPAKLKKPPLDFTIRSADQSKAVVQDPSVECHETFNVQLGNHDTVSEASLSSAV